MTATTHPTSRRRVRGQAMVEYSIITWLLVVALLIGATVRILPGPGGQSRNVIEAFLAAYQSYYDSYGFMLSLPFP